MNTIYSVLSGEESDKEIYKKAGDIIRLGGLVAFPTETVYGLGGDALNSEASGKIYAAKGRPSDNPLIVHIAELSALQAITESIPEAAYRLAEEFWPGPLTMVLKKNDKVPYETTGGLDTVAVRMPEHKAALEFIRNSDGYIAAPSANLSGRPSPTNAMHVKADMEGRIDMIIDGGAVGIGVESTIIDLTGAVPMLLRPGYISIDMLEAVLGEVEIDPAISGDLTLDVKPKAPGMKYKHYAPKGELFIVKGEAGSVADRINQMTEEAKARGVKAAVLATKENEHLYTCDIVCSVGERNDEESIARHLFGTLRDFDDMSVGLIYSEELNTPRMGMAIMNRLLKAAAHRIIEV